MINGLILTFISGLFFLIGIIIVKNIKNIKKISLFSFSLAFAVMLGLIIFDVGPEVFEDKNYLYIIPVLIGFIILVLLDKLIPHHVHHHHEVNDDIKEHNNHITHIGIMTIIALTIHNMIEGISLYNLALTDLESSILMLISIGCHNLPLGFQIGNSIDFNKNNIWLLILLVFSAVIGALLGINLVLIGPNTINIIMSLTLGMLIYILFMELFKEVVEHLKERETIYGIIVGVIIVMLTTII